MAEIQEIPVDNAAEIEDIAAKNSNNAAENAEIAAEIDAPPTPAPAAPKRRGRPKGSTNKPKAPAQPAQPAQLVQPAQLAQPAQPAPAPQYFSSPPDPTLELLGILRQGFARQLEQRAAKYASWVQRF